MSRASAGTAAIEVFFSYAHEDEGLRDELAKHLSMLKRQHVIADWHDRRIPAGTEWAPEIDEHLDRADFILLLVSSDFLASDYCYDVEVRRAMERHAAGKARVIPVILRPADWRDAPFGKLTALPKDGRPVTDWPNRDDALLNVVRGIRASIEEVVAARLNPLMEKLKAAEAAKNWPQAIEMGERILRLRPAHDETRARTAAAYLKEITRWVEDTPPRGFAPWNLRPSRKVSEADMKRRIGAAVDRIIELAPDQAEGYYWRATFVTSRAIVDRLADLTRALALAPDSERFLHTRASLHEEIQDYDAALADYERVLEFRTNPALQLAFEQGARERKRDWWERFCTHKPEWWWDSPQEADKVRERLEASTRRMEGMRKLTEAEAKRANDQMKKLFDPPES